MTLERLSLERQVEAVQWALLVIFDAPRKMKAQDTRYWRPALEAALETLRALEFGRATLG
jgi:hypothetical protein